MRRFRVSQAVVVMAGVAGLLLAPTEAMACSCVDWSRVETAKVREAFLREWETAEVAVSGEVVSVSDVETVVNVGSVLKGRAPNVLQIFPSRPGVQRRAGGALVAVPDCRPKLSPHTEYLILLFKNRKGSVDAGVCSVWDGSEREQRLGWLPPSAR